MKRVVMTDWELFGMAVATVVLTLLTVHLICTVAGELAPYVKQAICP